MFLVSLCEERETTSQSEVPPPLLYKRGPPHLGGVNFAFGEALPSFALGKGIPSFGFAEIHPFVALSNDKEFRSLRRATAELGGSAKPLKRLERNFQ